MDLNHSMDSFRVASRELFNHYFRVPNPYPTTELHQAGDPERIQQALHSH